MGYGSAGGSPVDGVTLEKNTSGQLQIKDGGVDNAQLKNFGITKIKGNLTYDNTGITPLVSADAVELIPQNSTWTKMKTLSLDAINTNNASPIILNIAFSINNNGGTTKGRIYKNGVPFGTERTSVGATYPEFTELLSFAVGDTIELWCWNNAGTIYETKNFRILGDVTTFMDESLNTFDTTLS